MRTPSVIKVKVRGRRYRTYVRALADGEMQCGFCGEILQRKHYLVHAAICEEHPLQSFIEQRHPRTGETPQQVLERLAARLNCEPRYVADRVIRMLEERAKQR